jgi:hypothetical protein
MEGGEGKNKGGHMYKKMTRRGTIKFFQENVGGGGGGGGCN